MTAGARAPADEGEIAAAGSAGELPPDLDSVLRAYVPDEALRARLLERLGYTVLTAATPAEAMDLARQHAGSIDLLLTDVVMPSMNGRDLARHLQALYPEIRCLFMSGYTADVIAQHGVLDEGVRFLQKPFTREALATKVRGALQR